MQELQPGSSLLAIPPPAPQGHLVPSSAFPGQHERSWKQPLGTTTRLYDVQMVFPPSPSLFMSVASGSWASPDVPDREKASPGKGWHKMPGMGASGQLWLGFSGEGAWPDVCEAMSLSFVSSPVDSDGVSAEPGISLLSLQTDRDTAELAFQRDSTLISFSHICCFI